MQRICKPVEGFDCDILRTGFYFADVFFVHINHFRECLLRKPFLQSFVF